MIEALCAENSKNMGRNSDLVHSDWKPQCSWTSELPTSSSLTVSVFRRALGSGSIDIDASHVNDESKIHMGQRQYTACP